MPVGIVTGASRGLGLALVHALVEHEWRLVVDARGAAALERAVADLEGVVAIAGDVADPEHRWALVEAAGARIDLLVNNAGVLGPSPQPLVPIPCSLCGSDIMRRTLLKGCVASASCRGFRALGCERHRA